MAKERPEPKRKPATADDTPDELLTAEDLFGELVDQPAEPTTRTARREPIRVRVTEPGHAPPPPDPDPALPAEVAALLDAFPTDPEREAASAPAAEPSQETTAPEPEGSATDPGPGAPEAGPLDALLSGSQAKPSADVDTAPGPEGPPAADEEAAARPASRVSTRFKASSPLPPAEEGLDLAALAASAFGAAEAGEAELPPAEPGGLAFGPYQLLERVAKGGMAEVFRAKRRGVEGFEKVVAVKRILPHLSDNPEFVEMFVNEAKMVAGLTHPNIVQIFDLGRIEDSYFIAMEYVHGRDLRTIERRARENTTPLPASLAALVASRVCAALEYAHRKKDDDGHPLMIVHRDISPQNILISFEGEVKLTDFGIAKAAAKASTTDRGALRGKILFMSPEQAWGKPLDRRSDIFSLGVVLYELLAGQKPFVGTPEMGILDVVRQGKVAPLSSAVPGIPAALEHAVMRALARAPEERYQDAAEMQHDLERAIQAQRPPPSSAGLARYLESLFDPSERGDPAPRQTLKSSRADGDDWLGSDSLDLDFDRDDA